MLLLLDESLLFYLFDGHLSDTNDLGRLALSCSTFLSVAVDVARCRVKAYCQVPYEVATKSSKETCHRAF